MICFGRLVSRNFRMLYNSCLEIKKHECRGLAVTPQHNVSNLLDTAVYLQLSNRELVSVVSTLAL